MKRVSYEQALSLNFKRIDRDVTTRRPYLKWDDLLLTIIMLIGAIQDLVWGVFRLISPRWTLQTISNFNETEISFHIVRLTRVGSWGNLESGILGVLLVSWRAARWYKMKTFSGQNFQFGFLIQTIGKTGAFLTNASICDWDPFGPDAPKDNIIVFVRALLSFIALLISISAYRETWEFVKL